MRIALVLMLAVAACNEEKPPPQQQQPPAPEERVAVGFQDVRLLLPKEFTAEVKDYQQGQRLFFGREHRGFRPSIQIIRRPFKGTTQAWFDRWHAKYQKGPQGKTRVVESGRTNVAGRSGHVLVYQVPGGDRVFTCIAWLWVHDGHGYIVRGLAEQNTFAMVYRPQFERVSRTVRLEP